MMTRTSFRTTWLPLGLAVLALVFLNAGLYMRLASQPVPPAFSLPYNEDFATLTESPYAAFGGDWAIRDAALIQLSTSGYDLMTFVDIDIAPEQTYTFETSLRYLGGSMGGGVVFNAQSTANRQRSHIARFNVDGGTLWLIYGYFGDDSDFNAQGSAPLDIAPDDDRTHRLRVEVSDGRYALLIDDAIVVDDVPLEYAGGAVGFVSATSQVAFDDVNIYASGQAVAAVEEVPPAEEVPDAAPPAETVVQATGMAFADTFENVGSSETLWLPISGEWVGREGAFVQQMTDGYDLSAVYQQAVTYPLTIEADFRHEDGTGGGLLFDLPDENSKNGGHMVRYFASEDGETVIAWGHFDTDGVFTGQGSYGVATPGDSLHTLAVRSDGATYAVTLDGAELVTGVPVVEAANPGRIGLTASQSVVAFEAVRVYGGETVAETTTANIDAAAASGTWLVEEGIITQTETGPTDYIAGTGLAGEQFTVSVDIVLPQDMPDVGAGIVFHMTGRDDPRQGYMVRFGSGGGELFWGRYDAEGVFAGAGGIPLEPGEGDTRTLLLVVRTGNFDIQVDGVTLVEAIPIEQSSGWIGLLSFGGPVTFSNVSVQLGG